MLVRPFVMSSKLLFIFVSDNKYLFGCGWNKYKQLKNDSKQEYYAFTFLHDFSKEEVLELKTGPWNSAVLCK